MGDLMGEFCRERMKKADGLLRAYIDRQYVEHRIGKMFGSLKDEALIKRAANWALIREVPAYLRTPERFGSGETQQLLTEKAKWFFEGLKAGTIHVVERKSITSDMEWSIEVLSVLETRNGTTSELFSEKTARRPKVANT